MLEKFGFFTHTGLITLEIFTLVSYRGNWRELASHFTFNLRFLGCWKTPSLWIFCFKFNSGQIILCCNVNKLWWEKSLSSTWVQALLKVLLPTESMEGRWTPSLTPAERIMARGGGAALHWATRSTAFYHNCALLHFRPRPTRATRARKSARPWSVSRLTLPMVWGKLSLQNNFGSRMMSYRDQYF